MRRFWVIMLGVAIIFNIAVFSGCSDDDDDNGTSSTTKAVGSMDDPLFIAALEPIEDASEQIPIGIEMMMVFLGEIMDSAAVPAKTLYPSQLGVKQPDTIWYNATTKYWYAVAEYEDVSWYGYYKDSIQFVHGASAVQWPDSALLTRLNSGFYLVDVALNTAKDGLAPFASDTVFKYTFGGYMTGAAGQIAALGDVTAGGSGNIFMTSGLMKSADEFYCSWGVSDNFTATSVQLNLVDMMMESGCPEGGSVTHNCTVNLDCQGDTSFTHTGSWYLKETFAGDTTHYVVENATHRWEFSEPCYINTKP